MLGLLGMAAANGAALLGAHELLRLVRTGTPCVDTVLFLLLRLAIVSAVTLVALARRQSARRFGSGRLRELAPMAASSKDAIFLREIF